MCCFGCFSFYWFEVLYDCIDIYFMLILLVLEVFMKDNGMLSSKKNYDKKFLILYLKWYIRR